MRAKPDRTRVLDRIRLLLDMAADEPSRANNYVKLAHKLRLKHNIRLPKALRRKYCRHCLSFWGSGRVRVRSRPKSIVYTCLKCGRYARIGR